MEILLPVLRLFVSGLSTFNEEPQHWQLFAHKGPILGKVCVVLVQHEAFIYIFQGPCRLYETVTDNSPQIMTNPPGALLALATRPVQSPPKSS